LSALAPYATLFRSHGVLLMSRTVHPGTQLAGVGVDVDAEPVPIGPAEIHGERATAGGEPKICLDPCFAWDRATALHPGWTIGRSQQGDVPCLVQLLGHRLPDPGGASQRLTRSRVRHHDAVVRTCDRPGQRPFGGSSASGRHRPAVDPVEPVDERRPLVDAARVVQPRILSFAAVVEDPVLPGGVGEERVVANPDGGVAVLCENLRAARAWIEHRRFLLVEERYAG